MAICTIPDRVSKTVSQAYLLTCHAPSQRAAAAAAVNAWNAARVITCCRQVATPSSGQVCIRCSCSISCMPAKKKEKTEQEPPGHATAHISVARKPSWLQQRTEAARNLIG